MKKKYNYFYKIVNKINGHFYYGIHSTDDLNDGYMGSGSRLHTAYKKYGVENFYKEILRFFDSRKEATEYEAEVVNEELVYCDDCYNVARGGEIGNTIGTFTAYDNSLKEWRRITHLEFDKNPSNFIKSPTSGKVVVERIDDPTTHLIISSDEYQNNKDKYSALSKNAGNGKVVVTLRNNTGTFIQVSREEYYNNRDLYITPIEMFNISNENLGVHHKNGGFHPLTEIKPGQVCVKDKQGNKFFVYKDDERYKTGELVPAYTGYKWTDEQKEKLKQSIKGKQAGEKNSQYGTKWLNKNNKTIKVKKEDVESYLNDGWKLGMK
jgi:hypothetical protein